ncbi:hypothetical protein ANN_15615 [Periplaneta americana]|uniref:Nuclease HARBI1 n=1 Tax=Periplaneta americana TaxID=6978 RepID=A0ABQ8SI31_PERAM|nr:hypothetical protein ANN_15615 [Periplaneta americana]
MDLREVGYDDRDWINPAEDRDRWRPYVTRSYSLAGQSWTMVTAGTSLIEVVVVKLDMFVWQRSYSCVAAKSETQERRGGALSSEMKMKIFLRYMADPGFQSGIAEEMGIHQTTVSKTVISVSKKIMEKANIWIKFPLSLQDITAAKAEWLQKFNFPSAIGVMDCTHVRIPKPTQHGDEYVNRKGFASINLQATCNAKECLRVL